jgi:hypothetical protein
LVDGLNRRVSAEIIEKTYEPARQAYRAADSAKHLQLEGEEIAKETDARWLLRQLR